MLSKRGQMGVFIAIGVLVIALIGGYFIFFYESGNKSGAQTQNPNINPDNQENSQNNAELNTIEITSSGFSPSTLTINQGETVTFINKKSSSVWPASDIHPTHTVYSGTSLSEHCPDTENNAFDACRGLSQGESYSFTFEKTGEWNYHDHMNPSDTGTIIVQ